MMGLGGFRRRGCVEGGLGCLGFRMKGGWWGWGEKM